jgi:ubiquinone/menaquinone biosynthesis C-methylase UbiE
MISATDTERAEVRLQSILAIAGELKLGLGPGSKVLDFGCGLGLYTLALRQRGMHAYGCDVWRRFDEVDELSRKHCGESLFSYVSLDDYRLPYADASFDFIFSDHVFEHVLDYDTTLREVRRVLRPGGVALHIFPSINRIIESHVKIPFSGRIRWLPWLRLWHRLGAGGEHKTAEQTATWIAERLNYLPKRELARQIGSHFEKVRFVEKEAMRANGHRLLGILGPLVSEFHVRVVALS